MADPLASLNDRQLVERAQKGDTDAFRILVERHQDRIYNAILRFCGHAEDAFDICQRAFINAFRKLSDFKGDSAFSTWMYLIAFNQSVSFRRESGKVRPVSLQGAREDEPLIEPAVDSDPGGRLESDDNRRKVQQALQQLESGDRQIIVLKDLEDRSYDEIARILGIPKGTVRSRLFRARQELKERLKALIGSPT